MDNMIVLHHNKDLDGFSSGAVCKLKYPDAVLIGWDYAEPIPDFEQFRNRDVIMIDITFPIAKIDELAKITNSLTIVDHHVSFCKDYYAFYHKDNKYEQYSDGITSLWLKRTDINLTYVYKKDRAACEIGWEWLFPDTVTPFAITLLGRYDTWRQKEGDWENETLPFQYFMRVQCTSAETFNPDWFKNDYMGVQSAVLAGNMIVKYQSEQDRLACQRSAFERKLGGYRAICLNTRAFSSNTMASVYDPAKHDIMVGIEFTGTKWSISLRSDKPGVDVSLIAKSRGGGGHKAAAGFESNLLDTIFDRDLNAGTLL